MDDVDAVQAQIARNMLDSGDWVTARLDGVAYLEKSPLKYWMMAVSYMIFGVHDWAARIPFALAAVLLCWITARFGRWAFGARAGMAAGLALASCVGLFLFTRILIPDAMLTLTLTLAMWSLLRALDEEEPRPRLWAFLLAASIGVGLLLKGLIAAVFLAGGGGLYLLFTKQLFRRRTWQRIRPFSGTLVILVIAAPWHVLATLRNPPYFDFTMRSEPGAYHGFFWFYFINEHVFRFLNMRYPRDYNTVPRALFWLLHLVWLFPWSAFLPAALRLNYRPLDRAGRTRLLLLCWAGFILLFFTFSTTQEYYSMPCYPALALLIGSAAAADGAWIRGGLRAISVVAALAAVVIGTLLFLVWNTAGARRHFRGADAESGALHAVAGAHDRPDAALLRVSETAAGRGGSRLPGGRYWRLAATGSAGARGGGSDDGPLHARRAAGAGGLRSLHVFAAAGRGACGVPRRAR